MYLTSGAKVSTRRSRSLRSPVALYCCQSASVSSADMRRAVAVFMGTGFSLAGRDGRELQSSSAMGPPLLKDARTDLGQMSRPPPTQKWGRRPSGGGRATTDARRYADHAGHHGAAPLQASEPRPAPRPELR